MESAIINIKKNFFSINSTKNYSKKHNFSTAITYIQAKCNDFKQEAKPPKMQSTSYVWPWSTHSDSIDFIDFDFY